MSRTDPSAVQAAVPRVAARLRGWSRRLRLAADLDAARDELAEAHAALARQKAFTDALLETIEVGIVSCDADGVFVVSNRAEREIFGLERGLDGMVPEDLRHLIVAWDTEGHRLTPETYPLMRALRGDDMSYVDVVVGPAEGPQREIVVRASRIHAADGSVLGAVAALSDVTAERSAMRALDEERHKLAEAQASLTHAALHDSLTGLPNRAHLVATLGTALERASVTGEEVAVLFVDLDGFKTVNDTGGHSAGDVVLRETARRLQRVLRPEDHVARVGGDEFVVVVQPRHRDGDLQPDAPDIRSCAVSLAARVAAVVGRPVTVAGLDHRVTASIGITYAGAGTGPGRDRVTAPMTVDDVLHQADAAMYRAKERGKDRYEVLETVAVDGPVRA